MLLDWSIDSSLSSTHAIRRSQVAPPTFVAFAAPGAGAPGSPVPACSAAPPRCL